MAAWAEGVLHIPADEFASALDADEPSSRGLRSPDPSATPAHRSFLTPGRRARASTVLPPSPSPSGTPGNPDDKAAALAQLQSWQLRRELELQKRELQRERDLRAGAEKRADQMQLHTRELLSSHSPSSSSPSASSNPTTSASTPVCQPVAPITPNLVSQPSSSPLYQQPIPPLPLSASSSSSSSSQPPSLQHPSSPSTPLAPDLLSILQRLEERLKDSELSKNHTLPYSPHPQRTAAAEFASTPLPHHPQHPPPAAGAGRSRDGGDGNGQYWRDRAMQLEEQLRSSEMMSEPMPDPLASFSRAPPLHLPSASASYGLYSSNGRMPSMSSLPSSSSASASSMEALLRSERDSNDRMRQQISFLSEQLNQVSRHNLEISEARVAESNQWRVEMAKVFASYKAKASSSSGELSRAQADLQHALQANQQLRQQVSMLEMRNSELANQLRRQQEMYALQNQELFATIQDLDRTNF